MIEHYQVERYDEVTAKQLKEVGFDSGVVEFLASQGVTKDDVSDFCDRAADENLKLDAIVGGVLSSRTKVSEAQVEVAAEAPAEASVEAVEVSVEVPVEAVEAPVEAVMPPEDPAA